jgi:hypothetical protein
MKTIQIRISRSYFKETFIDVEVEDGELDIDFLVSDKEIDKRLEDAIEIADLIDGETDYEWTDETDNNGGHL